MQARAVQHVDELAAERDQLQVCVNGLRRETIHVQEQLVEQQASPHRLQSVSIPFDAFVQKMQDLRHGIGTVWSFAVSTQC